MSPPPAGTTSSLDINGQGGADAVFLGSLANTQSLNGTITVGNSGAGTTALDVDDSADTTSRSVTIGSSSLTGTMVNGTTVNYNHLGSLEVVGGSGGNTFTVDNTPFGITTTLLTGTSADTTDVLADGVVSGIGNVLDINGQAGDDIVDLGSASSAQDLNGTINVTNASGLTALTVDDSADTMGQSLTIDNTSLTGSLVNTTVVTYADLSSLTVLGGSGGNSFTVNGSPSGITTTLNKGSGADNSVNVAGLSLGSTLDLTGTGGPDTVTIGPAPAVSGKVNIDEAPGSTKLVINLSNDGVPHALVLSSNGIISTLHDSLDNLQDITYTTSSLASLTIDTDPTQDESLDLEFGGGGNPIPTASQPGLIFNAGDPAPGVSHVLTISGELASGPFESEIHNANDQTVFPQVGQYGSIAFTDQLTINTSLDYTGLNPLTDTSPAINYTFIDSGYPDQSFTAIDGPILPGPLQTLEFESTPTTGPPPNGETTDLANKTNVVFEAPASLPVAGVGLNGLVNIPLAPTGLGSLVFITATNADNNVSFESTPPGVATSLLGGSANDVTNVTGLGVAATTMLELNGGAGTNTLNYDAGGETPTVLTGTHGEIIISIPGAGTVDAVNYQNINITDTTPIAITPGPAVTINTVEGFQNVNTMVSTFTAPIPSIIPGPRGLPASDFTSSLDWGDPFPDPGAGEITQDASDPSVYYVTGTHTFLEHGTYSVTSKAFFSGGTVSSLIGGITVSVTFPASIATTPLAAATATVVDAKLNGTTGNQITGVEGNSTGTVLLGSFTDDDPAATVADFTSGAGSTVINWGDGSAPQTLTAANYAVFGTPNGVTFTISAAHTYSEEGTYPYTITVTDTGGPVTLVSGAAIIADAPLSAVPVTPFAINTGIVTSGFVGEFTDANVGATTSDFTGLVDWGDGTPTTVATFSSTGTPGEFTVDGGSHAYAKPGGYTININVFDKGGSTVTLSVTGTVTDLPVTGATKSFTAVAGQSTGLFPLATFEDPNTLATLSSVNATLAIGGWGDGTPPGAGVGLSIVQIGVDPTNSEPIFEVLGSHTYANATPPGLPDTLSVIITTSGGVTTTLTSPPGGGVTVLPAKLNGTTGNSITGIEGTSTGTVLLGSFTDNNPGASVADFTTLPGSTVVNWGDGSAPQTLTAANYAMVGTPNGVTFAIGAAHTYAEEGTFAYTITVTSVDGAVTIIGGSAIITDAPLTAGAIALGAGNSGIPLSDVLVGTFTDGNAAAPITDFTGVTNWGDSSPNSLATFVAAGGGVFDVFGSHTYAGPGVFTVRTNVFDVGGSTTTVTATYTITDLPVTGSTNSFTAVEGQNTGPFVLATFEDPNTLATLSSVNATLAVGGWGDGTPTIVGVKLAVVQTGVDPTNGDPIFDVVGNHTYAEETGLAPDPLSVIITTVGGVTTTLTSPLGGGVIVLDAKLIGTSGNEISGVEGNPTLVGFLGSFTDNNQGATVADFTAGGGSTVIDWGDGSAPQTLTAADITSMGTPNGVTWLISATHTYPSSGTFAYTLTVTDDGGATTIVNGSAFISGAPLIAGVGVSQSGHTGIPFTNVLVGTFTAGAGAAVGDFTGLIDWGDGSPISLASFVAEGGGVFDVFGSHTYARPGVFTVQTDVFDGDGAKVSLFATFTITDLPVTGAVRSFTAVEYENTGTIVLGTFENPNTLATVANVHATLPVGGWGDGTPTAVTTLAVTEIGLDPTTGDPIFQITGSHTYAEEGTFTLNISVTTSGGVVTALTPGTVTVIDAKLIGSSGNEISGVEGTSTGTALLGTFTDNNQGATVADFTSGGGSTVVNWGDGSAPQTLTASDLTAVGTPNGVTWEIDAAHTYTEEGTYAYTVTVTDDGGAVTVVNGSAIIADAAADGGRGNSLDASYWCPATGINGRRDLHRRQYVRHDRRLYNDHRLGRRVADEHRHGRRHGDSGRLRRRGPTHLRQAGRLHDPRHGPRRRRLAGRHHGLGHRHRSAG